MAETTRSKKPMRPTARKRSPNLQRQITALRTQVRKMADQKSFVVPIVTLSPEPLALTRDIPVVVQPTGDDFIATFYDAGISASGDNEQEAVANLKDLLVAKFRLLGSLPETKLGKGPRRQIAVLRTLVREGR